MSEEGPSLVQGHCVNYFDNAGKKKVVDPMYYPLSYGVPVRERYGSTLLPATREQHDQNCTQSH